MRKLNKKFLSPLFLILFFNGLTLFIYITLYEKSSENNNDALMILFLFLTFLFFVMGYLPSRKLSLKTNVVKERKMNQYIFFIFIFIALYAFISILIVYYPTPQLLFKAVLDPQGAYEYVKRFYRSSESENTNNFIGFFNTFISSFKSVYFLYGIFYWNQMKKIFKVIFLITFILNVVYILLIGAMINLAQLFILALPLLLLKLIDNDWRVNLKLLGVSSLVLLALFYLLGIRKVFSESINFLDTLYGGLMGIVFYISHGYEGLSKSIVLPFESTYGEVVFRGISKYFLDIFALESRWNLSFLYKNEMQNGWPSLQVWSTGFTWIASDFSFYLIPFIFLLLGIIFRNAWIDFLNTYKFIDLLFIANLLLFFLMLPANNQIFHTFSNSIFTITISSIYFLNKWKEKSMRNI